MQGDIECFRKLLLDCLKEDPPQLFVRKSNEGGDGENKEYYHVGWLADAGLLKKESGAIFSMTNKGFDFVTAIRDENDWEDIKYEAGEYPTLNSLVRITLELNN